MAETGIVRYLPTPSDRMGLLWTLLTIKDGVILELGPSGTTHYSMESISEFGIPMRGNLYCTHIDEDNIIMGDTARFEEVRWTGRWSRHWQTALPPGRPA